MESADFLSFVVTRFPSTRPHGISRTSFLVYSRNLRTWATSIFLDFSALGHLIHPIRLIIAFLFVEPRFRYPFLSPLPHDSQAWESLLGSPVAGAHGGLTPQMYDMPVVLQKQDRRVSILLILFITKGFDWIKFRCLVGWQNSKNHTHTSRNCKTK